MKITDGAVCTKSLRSPMCTENIGAIGINVKRSYYKKKAHKHIEHYNCKRRILY